MTDTHANSPGVRALGWFILLLPAGAMIFAGSGKLFNFAPPEVVEGLKQVGLAEERQVIGAGAIATGLWLLIPYTSSLGVLLASSYWGGAICVHMAAGESLLVPSALLALTWLGATLRDPAVMNSFAARS